MKKRKEEVSSGLTDSKVLESWREANARRTGEPRELSADLAKVVGKVVVARDYNKGKMADRRDGRRWLVVGECGVVKNLNLGAKTPGESSGCQDERAARMSRETTRPDGRAHRAGAWALEKRGAPTTAVTGTWERPMKVKI